ncbi:MAG: radical SAM protein [Muribaculaceae bacterium]
MQTVLFHETVFGPIHSRRLGISLGINLMPNDGKICSFDCVYCEAGYNAQGQGSTGVPTRNDVHNRLNAKLSAMHAAGEKLDVITFSGNGEPTLHPNFKEIVHDVLLLRNKFYPEAKVSVLSNSTMVGRKNVADALRTVDNNILKLDSAINSTLRLINQPKSVNVQAEGIINDLKQFSGSCIVQTMMLRGEHDGNHIDNTTDTEVDALIAAYLEIRPREVMLYSIDRRTPEENLRKVSREELEAIARRIEAAGITVQVN